LTIARFQGKRLEWAVFFLRFRNQFWWMALAESAIVNVN